MLYVLCVICLPFHRRGYELPAQDGYPGERDMDILLEDGQRRAAAVAISGKGCYINANYVTTLKKIVLWCQWQVRRCGARDLREAAKDLQKKVSGANIRTWADKVDSRAILPRSRVKARKDAAAGVQTAD